MRILTIVYCSGNKNQTSRSDLSYGPDASLLIRRGLLEGDGRQLARHSRWLDSFKSESLSLDILNMGFDYLGASNFL